MPPHSNSAPWCLPDNAWLRHFPERPKAIFDPLPHDAVQVEDNYITDPIVYQGRLTANQPMDTYTNDNQTIRDILGKTGNVVKAAPPGFVDVEKGDFRLKPGNETGSVQEFINNG